MRVFSTKTLYYDPTWSEKVTTDSVKVPEGTFTKSASEIANILDDRKVSKNTRSAIRMIQFYINRAGTNLTNERKDTLESAKKILHERLEKSK